MSYSQNHIVVSAGWPNRTLTPAGDGGLSLYQPCNGWVAERARRLQFAGLYASNIASGTTTFEWRIHFEVAMQHTRHFQNNAPLFIPATAQELGVEVIGCTIHNSGYVVAATEATAPDTGFFITIPEWVGVRIRTRTEIVHTGTAPSIRFALNLTEWGE